MRFILTSLLKRKTIIEMTTPPVNPDQKTKNAGKNKNLLKLVYPISIVFSPPQSFVDSFVDFSLC